MTTEMQILRGWQAIRADWYFNEIEKQKRNTPAPAPKQETREEYIRRAIQANDWDSKPSANNRVNDLIRGALAK